MRVDVYQKIVGEYWELLQNLYVVLQRQITFTTENLGSSADMQLRGTIAKTVLASIEESDHDFVYPPAAWVEPREGLVQFEESSWEYFFHGGGVSFFHDGVDVSGEFTYSGRLGITVYTLHCYFDTTNRNVDVQQLVNELEENQILIPEPPILLLDDQTYVLLVK